MATRAVRQVLEWYPRIFFACHVRHARDPRTRREISAHQASILDHLDAREPTSMLALARHMGVTASTMSLSTDRLVRGGWVVRERDAHDGRRVNLRLTPAGVRIKQTDRVLDAGRVKAMLSHLSNEDSKRALEGLRLLAHAAMTEMHERSGAGGRRAVFTEEGELV